MKESDLRGDHKDNPNIMFGKVRQNTTQSPCILFMGFSKYIEVVSTTAKY